MRTQTVVGGAVVTAALSMLVTGAWAWVSPANFAEWANWPNHVHFLHDAGVFQIGIGLMLLVALWWRDVLAVGLAGFLLTNTLHAVNHAMDLDLGGHASDAWQLLVLSTVAAIGLTARLRVTRRRDPAAESTA